MKSASARPLAIAISLLAASAVMSADAPKGKTAASAPAEDAPAAAAAAPLPETVAVVEGVEIKKAELEKAFADVLAEQNIPAESIPAEQRTAGYRQILDGLIVEKLITKRAADVKVTDEEVSAVFNRYVGNFGSEAELKSQVEKSGQNIDKVKEDIRASLRQRHWVDAQIKGKAEVTDAEAEAFYKENPTRFERPETVRASHILISVPQDAAPDVVVEKEKQAKAIAARVKKGEDFNKLATELSEDPSAKQNGGDLDFFAKEQMVPEFSTAAFAMKKDEISEPVRSQFGYHVIKLTDRKAPETVTLDQAKPQLMAGLKQQKSQQEVEKLIRGIRESADVKVHLP